MMWSRMSDFDRMFRAMNQISRRMSNLFDEGDPFYGGTWQSAESEPKTNLYDTGNKLEIRAELPGLNREDVKIRIQGNYLEIRCCRQSEAPEGYTSHRIEKETTEFSRCFTLPCDVDSDKTEASLKNGLLTLSMPKSEIEKSKRIPIN